MKTYDWIVVGGGITGAALAYELVGKKTSVLLLEKEIERQGATRYSYGGLAYWSGTSELTRQLCEEGIERHRILSEELDTDTQFRELDLLLTIDRDDDPQARAASYERFAIPPKLLSVEEACESEPLLNRREIAGALTVRHGHINPEQTNQGYIRAFRRAGGTLEIGEAVELLRDGDRVKGVRTLQRTYHAANTVVCAGGLSRALLKASGFDVPVYFTHAEMLETPKVDLLLRTLVMPANLQRFNLEAQASRPEVESLWDESDREPVSPILDAGAIQFLEGSFRIGQLSRALTTPFAPVDAAASEAAIRKQVGKVLPALENLPGTWHQCLVAFSGNGLPVVGEIKGVKGAYVFSGFTNPLVFIPPLAQRFASWATGKSDEIIAQLSPAG